MSLLRTFTLVAAIPFLPAVTDAAEPGWYVGAAYVDVSPDINEFGDGDAHTVHGDSGFKLIGGFQMLEWLAVEAGYADLGNAAGNADVACIPEDTQCGGGEFNFEARTVSVAALASLGVGPVDFLVRAGVLHWETDGRLPSTPPGASVQAEGTDPELGIGIRLNLRQVALRLEFERQYLEANRMDLVSLGATYTFGR